MPKNRVRFFHQGRTMSSINSISPDKLPRLIGVAHCPALIDLRTEEDFKADPRFLPSAVRRRAEAVAGWLLAASLGLSRIYANDLEQLEAGMALYDAFYRWCRDASDEPHTWPAIKSWKAP